jgi:hypothetical protein
MNDYVRTTYHNDTKEQPFAVYRNSGFSSAPMRLIVSRPARVRVSNELRPFEPRLAAFRSSFFWENLFFGILGIIALAALAIAFL